MCIDNNITGIVKDLFQKSFKNPLTNEEIKVHDFDSNNENIIYI